MKFRQYWPRGKIIFWRPRPRSPKVLTLGVVTLHEILHINLRVVRYYENKECLDNEETFVRDICNFIDKARSDS